MLYLGGNNLRLAIHLCLGSRATPEVGEQPSPALQARVQRWQRQLRFIYVTSGAGTLMNP